MKQISINKWRHLALHSKAKAIFIVLLALVCSAVAFPSHAADHASPGQKFQLALEMQTAGQYEEMFSYLRSAADDEHLEAQEMLGIALLIGPSLYGEAVQADRCEASKWIKRALSQGSEIARYQWRLMTRARQASHSAVQCASVSG